MSNIVVPINASGIPADERGKQRLRVAVQSGKEIISTVVDVTSGQASAQLQLDTTGSVTIAVGPESTSAADLFRRNTPTVTVRPQAGEGGLVYKVNPIVITLPIWRLWLIWCRTFTISGYVYGTDGNPVPSAQVSAYNVDWFWWWSSTSQVGPTAITDPTGYFSIEFTWCCGWLPWYWWELQEWRLDPVLVDKIQPVLKLNPGLHVNSPSPELSLSFSALNPQPLPPFKHPAARPNVTAPELNPSTLSAIREKLVNVLPTVPEFERFCLWPWCPWTPWFDCDPNIIFKVTQSCGGLNNVILNENVWQARIDIPTSLSVTLTANSEACTIPPQPGQPDGACFLFTAACSVAAEDIGITGSGTLAGLANPGSEDQPFTGAVGIYGQFGYLPSEPHYADYYAIQYRPEGTSTWLPVPASALQPFSMTYFDATKSFPFQWFNPVFAPGPLPLTGLPGQFAQVYMSSEFFQLSNPTPPNDWGSPLTGQVWTNNIDQVAAIETAGFFTDGPYEFQIVGYTLETDGTISSNGALPGCGKPSKLGVNYNNDFTLYFANPIPGETYPDTAINSISFNGSALPPCGIITLPPSVPFSFVVNFTASDAEGFLDSYSLTLQYGTNPPTDLVSLASVGCVAPPPPSPSCGNTALSGGQVGPTYPDAIIEGAVRPFWNGGTMTLTFADGLALFPTNCAYELILTVNKRNIVNCLTEYDYYQETVYYSFTVLYS
jgi:hypothetical protein